MKEEVMMKWNGFAVSIPGNEHIRKELPCQDASLVMTDPRPGLIVCDGRGSAKLSHFGASGAVRAFASQCSILEPLLATILDVPEDKSVQWDKFCQLMYRTLMQVKLDLAAEHGEEEKEFDFTVAFALTGKHHIGCFQVGDGAIVLRQDSKCISAFEPDKGEFANQTHFLRLNGESRGDYHCALFDRSVNSGIAATSDGPEFKMFELPAMVPGKIFHRLFDDLAGNELYRSDLLTYLTRNDWNMDPRGGDDRSVALLVSVSENQISSEFEEDMQESVTQESVVPVEKDESAASGETDTPSSGNEKDPVSIQETVSLPDETEKEKDACSIPEAESAPAERQEDDAPKKQPGKVSKTTLAATCAACCMAAGMAFGLGNLHCIFLEQSNQIRNQELVLSALQKKVDSLEQKIKYERRTPSSRKSSTNVKLYNNNAKE